MTRRWNGSGRIDSGWKDEKGNRKRKIVDEKRTDSV